MEVKSGDIVFFAHSKGNGQYDVRYGMVDDEFFGVVCVDLFELRDRRFVNGAPINEFMTETKYKKLPKGWNYDTELFTIAEAPMSDDEKEFVKSPLTAENLKRGYELGYIVKKKDVFWGAIEADIANGGYRIIRKIPQYVYNISSTSIRKERLYGTYDEAKKEVDELTAEFMRQVNLSDYDWSVEQIDKTIEKWRLIHGETSEMAQEYHDWFMQLENIEDVETRVYMGEIQWRYEHNKKWSNIEL